MSCCYLWMTSDGSRTWIYTTTIWQSRVITTLTRPAAFLQHSTMILPDVAPSLYSAFEHGTSRQNHSLEQNVMELVLVLLQLYNNK